MDVAPFRDAGAGGGASSLGWRAFPSTFLCWILPTWPMVVCASLPLARISAKDPLFGGAARAATGDAAEGLLTGLLALELLVFRDDPLLGRWTGDGRMGGFATVAGLAGCATRGVLGPSDRNSSLAFRLIWVSVRGLGAEGPSPLLPLIWARRSPILAG